MTCTAVTAPVEIELPCVRSNEIVDGTALATLAHGKGLARDRQGTF